MDDNLAIREAAIRHCRLLSLRWGEAVPYEELARGFPFRGQWIKLVGPQGVFKPKELTDGPLTLLSTLASSYEDEHLEGDVVLYDYAPTSREFENDGLKRIAAQGKAVILLRQVKAKPRPEYMVFAPVVLRGFDDVARKVRLDLAAAQLEVAGIPAPVPTPFSKAYAETIVKARLHQAHFRREILTAYAQRCCICELRERPLLDAAHIVPDRLPEGVPEVRNGLAMCPTHHRAYDQNLVLVTEQYRVEVQRDRLYHAESEATARMILDFDGREILLPKQEHLRPDPEFLRRKIVLAA
ncbi:HNH endonuclease [Polyangium mundeleinium]|uniref:HNH endonuclease n=1 Tax=Polyangium mundeleinium TaxID=2995306 RepID=A0ABT5EP45_9BACT|nr:HNH endonuclease [Polyangium mundeleinium]MDC0743229.1 HNH endonuclease [Polyangium mundeleinium]